MGSPSETGGRKHRIADSFTTILISINVMVAVFVMLFTRFTRASNLMFAVPAQPAFVMDRTGIEFYAYVAVGVAMSLEFFYLLVFRGMEGQGKSRADERPRPSSLNALSADDEPISPLSPFS